MITSGNPRRAALLGWNLLALAIVGSAIATFRSVAYARHPDVLAWAFTFDLTLTIPLLYYALVIRGGFARAITIVPVFVICVAVAKLAVPHDQQQFLHQLRYLTAPLDVITMWLVARRLARGRGTGNGVVDRIMATELAVLRYGIFSWRKEAPAGFTVHKRNDWATIVAGFIVAIAAESLGIHLLLLHWSTRVAWIVTALDLYGILWLLGDYHALRLRPTTIEDGVLHLRYGLRWSAEIPLVNIDSLEPVAGSEWKRKGVLNVAMLDEPKLLIRLRKPVVAYGLAGLTKTIDTIAILADEAERFEAALRLAGCPAARS